MAAARSLLAPIALLIASTGCSRASSDRAAEGESSAMTVMTFNVLCWFCGDSNEYDPWETRLDYFGDIFERHQPDLVGLQELAPKVTVPGDVDQILAVAPGFEAIFYADDQGVFPDSTILYRTDRFDLVERGEYWLSPTPEEPRSTGFAAAQFPRLVVWAVFEDQTDERELFFATTHFDNNPPSQDLSAELLMSRTRGFAPTHPLVVTGDFNSRPRDAAFKTLTDDADTALTDSLDLASEWRVVSNQTPAPGYDLDARIDHVFLGGRADGFGVDEWIADLTVYGPDSRFPSDHRPIITTLTIE